MAQLMPLPLTVSCFSKIQTGLIFLVPAHPSSPRKGPLNACVVTFKDDGDFLCCVIYSTSACHWILFCTAVPFFTTLGRIYQWLTRGITGVKTAIYTSLVVYCMQYRCSSSTGLSIMLFGGATFQCLYAGQNLAVSVATKDWLHRGSILCPACNEICQVWRTFCYYYTSTSSLNFYRPDALPDAHPIVSKHWRHCQLVTFINIPMIVSYFMHR